VIDIPTSASCALSDLMVLPAVVPAADRAGAR
jgi:hypothetical protein